MLLYLNVQQTRMLLSFKGTDFGEHTDMNRIKMVDNSSSYWLICPALISIILADDNEHIYKYTVGYVEVYSVFRAYTSLNLYTNPVM